MDPEIESPSDEFPTLAGGRRGALPQIDSYEIEEEIGSGGFARIYRARDTRTGRTVALKLLRRKTGLSEEVVQRFLREARALAAVDHDNVVRIHHVIDEQGVLGLSMEFIHGCTLAKILVEEGPLPAGEVAWIGVALCRAIAEVHRSGFIHRDIKAENVMREAGSGRIVLMDFGVTRSMNPESRLTRTGALVGTPVVMAPEQFDGKEIDERTDIYSLGCLLYFLTSGEHPVMGTTIEEIREKVLTGSVTDLAALRPDLPARLAEIIRLAMSVEPDQRFQSAAAMESKLQEWRESQAKRLRLRGADLGYRTAVIALLAGILLALVSILLYLWLGE